MKSTASLTLFLAFAFSLTGPASSENFSNKHRGLARQRFLEDDEINSEIPNNIPDFSIDNYNGTSTQDGGVCVIGCEGEYSELMEFMEDLWDTTEQEYELFFIPKGRFALAVGVIYENFPERVQQLHDDHPEVDTLILLYLPGSAADFFMVNGVYLAHELGYHTCVPSNGMVASGGTDFFLGGVQRYATPGAEVGIHSWAGEFDDGTVIEGTDLPRDHEEHKPYLALADAVCIPRDFYWQTLTYGLPMHWVTEEEIRTTFPYFRDCTETCHKSDSTTDVVDSSSSIHRASIPLAISSMFVTMGVMCFELLNSSV